MADTNYVHTTDAGWTLLLEKRAQKFGHVQLIQTEGPTYLRIEPAITPPTVDDQGGFTIDTRRGFNDLALDDTTANGVAVFARGNAQWVVYIQP